MDAADNSVNMSFSITIDAVADAPVEWELFSPTLLAVGIVVMAALLVIEK